MDICYIAFRLGNQTMALIIPGFQGLKLCIQYLASHTRKFIFIAIIIITDQISSDLHEVGLKLNITQPIFVYNSTNMQIIPQLLTEDGQFCGLFILFLELGYAGK